MDREDSTPKDMAQSALTAMCNFIAVTAMDRVQAGEPAESVIQWVQRIDAANAETVLHSESREFLAFRMDVLVEALASSTG